MFVVVVRVGGVGAEAVDVDQRAGVGVLVGVFVIGTAGVVGADFDGPVGLEGGEVVGGVEIEVGVGGGEVCEEAGIGWAFDFPVYDGEVGVDVVVLAGHVLGQRIVGEVVGVALDVVSYFEIASLPASEDLGHEGTVCH